jgi:transcriptional regulator with XRE-family HTH domain
MMTFGKRIRELRDGQDLSLREFAAKLGCSAPFISDIELGRRYPSEKVLKDIAQVLRVSIEELKSLDTRPPVKEMKRRIASDPRYALAFRTVIDKNISPDDLLALAKRKGKRKSTE